MESHPIAGFFPFLDDAELQSVADDNKTHGQRNPIWTYDGKILGDRSNFNACEIAGTSPIQKTFPENHTYLGTAVISPSERNAAPIYFRVPESFDYRKDLPSDLHRCKDDAHWLLNTAGYKCAFGDTDEDGYAHLYSGILKKVMRSRTYAKVRDSLVGGGWIDLSSSYYPGRYSKGYRISPVHLSERIKKIEATDSGIIQRIHREQKIMSQKERKLWLPIHCELANILEDLSIMPITEANLDRLSEGARYCQETLIDYIRWRIPRYVVGNTGRCYTPFTGLKRTFRPHLRLQGMPLAGVDIRCAQPALLAELIHLSAGDNVDTYIQILLDRLSLPSAESSWAGSGGPGLTLVLSNSAPAVGPDYDDFSALVSSGCFHECLIDLCRTGGIALPGDSDYVSPRPRVGRSLPQTPKEAVKILLMQDILAKKGRYPSDFERVFTEKFPTVHEYIQWFNSSAQCYPKPQYSELIRVLQRLESVVVIEHVAPRLVAKIPILTLHDAIYCRESDVGIVKDAFYETFAELGLRMQVKEELVCNVA